MNTIFRQAADSKIITNAHLINQGKFPIFSQGSGDFFFFPAEDAEKAADWIIEIVTERIPQKFGYDAVRDIQVISPIYRGPAGVIALNDRLQEKAVPIQSIIHSGFVPGDWINGMLAWKIRINSNS